LFWTGVSIAFYSGALIPMITNPFSESTDSDLKLEKSMLAMIVFGVGEVCGCLFIGQMIDYYGSKMVSLINVAIIVLMTFVTLAFIGINQFNHIFINIINNKGVIIQNIVRWVFN
jgi:predicted MFS family arabinose efflux permease